MVADATTGGRSEADPEVGRGARTSGPPIDPRLFRYAPASRMYVVITSFFAIAGVVATIVTAAMVASILSEIIVDPTSRSISAQSRHLWILGVALVARVALSFLHDRYAQRASALVTAQLRADAVDALTDPARTSPRELLRRRGQATTALLRGLDDLTPYLSGYVPALIITVFVTPIVVITIALTDWTSALIILVTLPLIPLFMILIGLMTRDRTARKMAAMTRLTEQLLDLIAGLPTLRALHRSRAPAATVAELGRTHQRSTMSALRVAFLSGGVLELLATLCVALVAVGIGLRLVYGEMSLYAGIFALILAPEAYLPLRQIGAQFHNSADGMAAARTAFELIERPAADPEVRRGRAAGRSLSVTGEPISLLNLGVHGRQGWAPYDLSAMIRPGEVTMLTGPNGSGKTTTLMAIMGLIPPDEGSVLVGSISVAELVLDALHEQVAWLPQQPVIVPGTVTENLRLFGATDPDAVAAAARATGFDDVIAGLPDGPDTELGAGGVGISAGQRQRLALTRVLASPSPLLLLDEPTAHLDEESEAAVMAALRRRAVAGDTVIVVSHRPSARDVVDRVIELPEVIGAR